MPYVNEDLKNESGQWILQWGAGGEFFMTRLGRLHNNMTQRANKVGSYQNKFSKSYSGVEVSDEFKDPQKFCEWAVRQIGYGLGYALDKDLLVPGNRVYCAERCVFLPIKLNTLITVSNRKGDGLIGAYRDKRSKVWRSQITVDGETRQLGKFATEYEAHEVYCAHKEALVRELAMQYRDTIDPRAFNALMEWKVQRQVDNQILEVENSSDERLELTS